MANRRNRKSGNNRRQQNSKATRAAEGYVAAMQGLRRSSATSPIPSGKTYRRPQQANYSEER